MAKRLKIHIELLKLHPDKNVKVLRTIINTVLAKRRNVMRQAHIFDLRLPGLGRVRSRANKVHKHSKSTLKRDRLRKRDKAKQKAFSKKSLLW